MERPVGHYHNGLGEINMKRHLSIICISFLLSVSASAQLTYFGYVGGADTDLSITKLKDFTNIAHVSTLADLNNTFVTTRVQALAQTGEKAIIDLGLVLWCGTD